MNTLVVHTMQLNMYQGWRKMISFGGGGDDFIWGGGGHKGNCGQTMWLQGQCRRGMCLLPCELSAEAINYLFQTLIRKWHE